MDDRVGGWGVDVKELNNLRDKLDKAGADMERVAGLAIREAYPIVRNEIARNMPKSDKPRQPTQKERWRTGSHAADAALYVRAKLRMNLRRTSVYAIAGPQRVPARASNAIAVRSAGRHFYMWYVARGRPKSNGGYTVGHPFTRHAVAATRDKAAEAMRQVMLKELDLID